jgi:hypothetical protein
MACVAGRPYSPTARVIPSFGPVWSENWILDFRGRFGEEGRRRRKKHCSKSCFDAKGLLVETPAERCVRMSAAMLRSSGRCSIVVVQHAAQTFAAQHCSTVISLACNGNKQPVAEVLVVSLAVIMQNELVISLAQ